MDLQGSLGKLQHMSLFVRYVTELALDGKPRMSIVLSVQTSVSGMAIGSNCVFMIHRFHSVLILTVVYGEKLRIKFLIFPVTFPPVQAGRQCCNSPAAMDGTRETLPTREAHRSFGMESFIRNPTSQVWLATCVAEFRFLLLRLQAGNSDPRTLLQTTLLA